MQRGLISFLVVLLMAPALLWADAGAAVPADAGPTPVITGGGSQEMIAADRRGSDARKRKHGPKDTRERRHKREKKRGPKKPPVPTCFGRKATITLKGDEGQVGTPANDVIIGGNGRNLISVSAGGIDRVCLGGGSDSLILFGTIGGRLLADGGPGADTIIGGNFDFGSAPGDVLLGGDGNDLLGGAAGADDLFGGAGNDRLFGGSGTDILDGGPGADTCQHSDDGAEFNC